MTTDVVGMLASVGAALAFLGAAWMGWRYLAHRRDRRRKMLKVNKILAKRGFKYRSHIEGVTVVALVSERLWEAAYAVLTSPEIEVGDD